MISAASHTWLIALNKPTGPARMAELGTAAAFGVVAMVLRWMPSYSRRTSGLRQMATVSARWVSNNHRPTRRQLLVAVFTGCAVGLVLGGTGGLLVGVLAGFGVLVFNARRASEQEARARQRLIAAAPPPVDLFAAALAAGLLPADAAAVVAGAFSGDGEAEHASSRPRDPVHVIADRFAAAAAALRQGADPEAAWSVLGIDAATAPVAAAALRASRTGAPAGQTVAKAARDIRYAAQQAAQCRIRAVTVQATAPLALCFLPAFVLVGVVPTALGLLTELHS